MADAAFCFAKEKIEATYLLLSEGGEDAKVIRLFAKFEASVNTLEIKG